MMDPSVELLFGTVSVTPGISVFMTTESGWVRIVVNVRGVRVFGYGRVLVDAVSQILRSPKWIEGIK